MTRFRNLRDRQTPESLAQLVAKNAHLHAQIGRRIRKRSDQIAMRGAIVNEEIRIGGDAVLQMDTRSAAPPPRWNGTRS